MWKGQGRSGIGEQTIIGEYEDWDGLSMNGRQWKNRLTQETRDLSGADYWHQRKALEPKMAEDIPTYVNGKPNISAFSEPVVKPKTAKTKSVLSSILLADRNYERLCSLSQQLDDELDSGQITDFEAYCAARKNIDQRLAKAWARVQRERGWDAQGELIKQEQYPSQPLDFTLDIGHSRALTIDYSILPSDSVFSGLKDDNFFKQCACFVLTSYKALSNILNNTKETLKEGLV